MGQKGLTVKVDKNTSTVIIRKDFLYDVIFISRNRFHYGRMLTRVIVCFRSNIECHVLTVYQTTVISVHIESICRQQFICN